MCSHFKCVGALVRRTRKKKPRFKRGTAPFPLGEPEQGPSDETAPAGPPPLGGGPRTGRGPLFLSLSLGRAVARGHPGKRRNSLD